MQAQRDAGCGGERLEADKGCSDADAHAGAYAFLVSAVVRWPLAGVIWHGINGDGQGWRRDARLLRAYTWATLLWALVFVARVVVQGLLYRYEEETWLGIARLVMGYPLVGVALLGTIWAVRRARRSPLPAV